MPIRKMNKSEIELLLESTPTGRLGLSKEGQPYVVPIHFLYKENKIYLHSKKQGMKSDFMNSNNNVCFECDDLIGINKASYPCKYNTDYRSIIAFGKASFIENESNKLTTLNEFVKKYAGDSTYESISIEQMKKVAVIQIDISNLSGKISEGNVKNTKALKYHHIGIPTKEKHNNEIYLKDFKLYTSGYNDSQYGIEWMRFEEDSPLPELIKTVPHIAFEVDDLDRAIEGKQIIIQPNQPSQGIKVAFIVDNGAPIEFLQLNNY
ncbi:MAG: pyridoxamine 5'-phosphate oxidase family protein [Chloroflexi bacterium]|nr:pyridoxamine 5'-phosphate oxidase family protein [Chloroflexota bacterium]